jgi:pimeloyl-ACP methyl ester carboxylesterase
MGMGSWSWMDVIGPLSAWGPVVAPDLPGSGRTRPADDTRRGVMADAAFLSDFAAALGLDRVILHGHSMGGLVAALLAGLAPDSVAGQILTSPPIPGRPDPPRFPGLWRLGLRVARPIGGIIVGAGIRLKADAWHRWRDDPTDPGFVATLARGTDATRISPPLLALVADEICRMRAPWRVDGAVAAAISVLAALTVDEREVREVVDRISAPTLLLWGAEDRAIPRAVYDDLVLAHPGWEARSLEGIGHLLPWEAPEQYVAIVGPWTAGLGPESGQSAPCPVDRGTPDDMTFGSRSWPTTPAASMERRA